MGLWCIDCNGGKINTEKNICERCGSQNIANVSRNMTVGDILDITQVSKDKKLLEAMSNLMDTDIIEYNLKMSYFREQLSQTKQIEERSKPKCPTCSSTNLSPISNLSKAGSVALFSIFSQKVKHQWKCNSCGYEW